MFLKWMGDCLMCMIEVMATFYNYVCMHFFSNPKKIAMLKFKSKEMGYNIINRSLGIPG